MRTSEKIRLVCDVFSQEPGATLLKELEQGCEKDLFDPDPYVHAYRSGKLAVVRELQSYLKLTNDQIKEIVDSENFDQSEGDYF